MELLLRRAVSEDSRFVWEVNNDPTTRARSTSTADIPWESHRPWFEKKVASPDVLFFIAERDRRPAAVARFEIAGNEATIGVAVAPWARGRGLGAWVIAAATDELSRNHPSCRAVAWIRPENTASIRAFARAGYRPAGSAVRDGVELARFER